MKKNTLWLTVASILSMSQIISTCAVSVDCSSSCSNTSCAQSKNTWLPRAFSSNASREITLEKTVFQTDSARSEWFGTFSFATEYMQNFGAKCNSCKNLGSLVFWGASENNTMTIGKNDGSADVDAWNFGLGNVQVNADGIGGTITLNPKVTQAGTDFMLYFTHKKDERGLYFKVHAPVGAIIVNPQLTEEGTKIDTTPLGQTTNALTLPAPGETAATITYNTTYFAPENRATSMTSAFAGGLGDGLSLNGLRRDAALQLEYGRISAFKQTEIRLADLSVALGYNLWANEKGLVALGFKATCPTGNVPTAQFALEPIFGRAGAWGVGGDLMAHYKAWENEAGTRFLDIWLQGDVLHLFSGRTGHRSFDLKANGKGSKYILLQHFHEAPDGSVIPGSYTQAVNVTSLPVYSKFAVEGSAALMFDFHCHNWNLAVSGEFWGRTKETLSINMKECVDRQKENLNHYGVVGRQASAFNVLSGAVLNGALGNPADVIPLVEPLAKINQSQDTITLNGGGNAPGAPLIGQVYFPTATYTPDLPASTTLVDGRVATNRIPADLNEALDICGAAAAKAFTGKIFGQFGYTFNDCRYTPNIAFIGGAEFTNKTNSAVQMWSVGLQGSINF